MSNIKSKKKIFLNSMDSWFSNFIIEYFRTDHMPESKNQTEFMCTINSSSEFQENYHIPLHFKPSIYKFDFNPSFKTELFSNDIFIYDLNTGNLKEVDYIIKGLKTLRIESEKILILISNIMTWAKTPDKYKTDSEDEIIFIHPMKEDKKEEKSKENKENESMKRENSFLSNLKEQSFSNSLMGGVNQSKLSIKQLQNRSKLSAIKEEKEENKIIVYYTDKDYLKRKPALKYFQFKYIENEAINLNQKANIKSYIICPGVIYGYGEKEFYYIFKNALLGKHVEEILLDKGRNIIPTIHMKDLVNIIAKVIEKKPSSNYILAFDQNKDCSLKNILRMIYCCIGDENNMIEKKEKSEEEKNKAEDNIEINENKEIIVKEENEENEKKEDNEEENLKEENAEKKEENNNNNKPSIHPFFSNKKYQLPEDFPRELLYLDVKILPSEFIKGESRETKSKDIITNPLFKWHCPSGIISNSLSVKKEFLTYRNLSSNKIFILGNPYTGKTTISQILSKIFHLPIITLKSIADFGKQFAGIKLKSDLTDEENKEEKKEENINNEENKENKEDQEKNKLNEKPEEDLFIKRKTSEENDLVLEIQKEFNDLEKNIAEAEEAYNKRPNKKKTDPPFDNNMYYRFSDELMVKILKQRLLENDSSIYGYIIDGFPKNYSQLKSLFNNEEKSLEYPNSILLFDDIEDDVCINRLKNSEEVLKDPKDPKVNILLERANRRLNKIKEDKGKEDYKSLKDFFDEEENNKIFKDKLMIIDGKNNTVLDIIKIAQEFIKKNNDNKINKIDEELECDDYLYDYVKIEEEKMKQNAEEENPNANENENANENLEEKEENKTVIEKEEPKEENNITTVKEKEDKVEEEKKEEEKPKPKSKIELEKENEFKLLEKKSEVLRRYLAENVLPLLSLGILHVANERPDDPVEALADYLLAKTFEVKKNEDGQENNENDNDNEEKEENENLEFKEEKKEENEEIMKEEKKEENNELNISPIRRKNTNEEIKESKESKEGDEDELNKAMIESNE